MRMPCRSVPAFGSVSASPPRISPDASFGSHCVFCAGVPNFSTASASIKCELKMPVTDIQTAEIRMTSFAYVVAGKPRPPCSVLDGRAEQAELLHLLDDVRGIAIGVVVLADDRFQVALDPLVDGVEQLRFIVGIELPRRGAIHCDSLFFGPRLSAPRCGYNAAR